MLGGFFVFLGNIFLPLAAFFIVLGIDDQQPERFAILFGAFGVVRSVRPQDGTGIFVVELSEPIEPPVNVDVVDQEIQQAVDRDADSDKKKPEMGRGEPHDIADGTGDSENQKEQIVFFKKAVLLVMGLVVVLVPIPENAVHNKFMRKPSDEFHPQNGCDYDSGIQ